MHKKLTGFAVLSLFLVIVIPAYAEVTEVSMGKSFYTIDEKISFVGIENEGSSLVNVVLTDPTGKSKLLGGFSDPEGIFETIPQSVKSIFSVIGTYNATAFVYKIENGTTISLDYDGDIVEESPTFVLELNSISDKEIEITKTITFTASLVDTSITDEVYSLINAPTGAIIDPSTGKFVWTPSKAQGNIQDVIYTFDVVVNHGNQEDREKVKITIKKAYEEPEPKQTTPEPKQTTPEPKVSIAKELETPASFVDETKDPQSYVDRYNNEASYKKWFDDNYSEYSSIYQAVGLEEPKVLAAFVDPNLDPQYYVDRYNKETTYKDWFDKTYPDMTIYDAVGMEEPEMEEPEIGECGKGTNLENGICVVVENSEGGGCLIATATYGTELSPQVQQLRELRDNTLLQTESGSFFMESFNHFYYSFSPTVADLERQNPIFKETVKLMITPMLSSLSMLNYADIDSESEMMGYGLGVIALNLAMYAGLPAVLVYKARK